MFISEQFDVNDGDQTLELRNSSLEELVRKEIKNPTNSS
jgi:hypothetical protein